MKANGDARTLPRFQPGTPYGLVRFVQPGHPEIAQLSFGPGTGLLMQLRVAEIVQSIVDLNQPDYGTLDTAELPIGVMNPAKEIIAPEGKGFAVPLPEGSTSWLLIVLRPDRPCEIAYLDGQGVCAAQLRGAAWVMRCSVETILVPRLLKESQPKVVPGRVRL